MKKSSVLLCLFIIFFIFFVIGYLKKNMTFGIIGVLAVPLVIFANIMKLGEQVGWRKTFWFYLLLILANIVIVGIILLICIYLLPPGFISGIFMKN